MRLLAERRLAVAALQFQPPGRQPHQARASRSSEDLPAPFSPLTSSAPPARPQGLTRQHGPAAPDAARSVASHDGHQFRPSRPPTVTGQAVAAGRAPKGGAAIRRANWHFADIVLRRIDFLEPHQKSPYKPDPFGRANRERPNVATGDQGRSGSLPQDPCLSTRWDGNRPS
jgi:hypothetical protein